MNKDLQIIMIISSLIFLCYIILMLRNKKIELKFTLSWLFTGICFLLFAIFPDSLRLLSNLLRIVEPVNTLFLFTIFFMLLIIFTLTIALSRNARRVKTLTQEIGIIKLELERLSNKVLESPSRKTSEK